MKKVIFVLGSEVDKNHAAKIQKKLAELKIENELFVASAHKNPRKVLEILEKYESEKEIVFVTIAGRSNALSGFCAGNSRHPVLACPPFSDKIDFLVNINSTLQMPSKVPVMTVLDPENCALAAARILKNDE